MSIVKTKGIVIMESNYGDFDKMLTILTPNLGKISCVAKGARRPNSKLLAGSQLFSFSDLVLFKTKDIYHMNSCDTIELFYDLRIDLDKLNLATKINKLIIANVQEEQNSYDFLMLYLETLKNITYAKENNYELILNIFKLRLLKYLGLMPNYSNCFRCKTKDEKSFTNFSVIDSSIICTNCKNTLDININSSVYLAIKYVLEMPYNMVFKFSLSGNSYNIFNNLVSKYFNSKLN